jgi:NAD(P)-dependent dehydrogenase (short-subunit alcohol dehydrogenase family)
MNSFYKTLLFAAGGAGVALLIGAQQRRSPGSFFGKVVVITGGARGLGLEMARRWCDEGARVAICSRSAEEIEAALLDLRQHGGEAIGRTCDVTSPAQVDQFVRFVLERWETVDVLVNNAGIIQAAPFECMTSEDFQTALATHFWGPYHMTRAVLPFMRERLSGRIVNISSIGGKIGVPHLMPYCASKFALAGFSECLRAEVAHEGIVVTTVCPGVMRTGSPRNALFKGRHRAEYAWFSISSSLPVISLDSGTAADRIIEACRRGDAETTLSLPTAIAVRAHGTCPEFMGWVMSRINRFLPRPGGVGTRNMKGWQSFSKWSPSWLTRLTEEAAWRNNEVTSWE